MAVRGPRRRLRLPHFDCGRLGAYFVTICTNRRALLFRQPEYLDIAAYEWSRSGALRAEIELDVFVVMPNNIHSIVWITNQADSAKGNDVLRTKRIG